MTVTINGSTGVTATVTPDNGSVTQAKLAAGVAGNGPAFSAYSTAPQTIASTVETKVVFNAEEYDTANCFDSVTNYRFQPNVPGYYYLTAQIRFNTDGQQTAAWITLYKNGASYRRLSEKGNTTAGTMMMYQMQSSALVYFNGSSDYVEVYVYVAGSSTLNIGYTDTRYDNYFQGFLARAA